MSCALNRLGAGAAVRLLGVVLLFALSIQAAYPGPPGGGGGAAGGAGGGTGAGAGGGASGGAAASGGAPTTPSGFFSQSSINFSRPAHGWANWSAALPPPPQTKNARDTYLCYEIGETHDPTVPFMLKSVSRFREGSFPCYSLAQPPHGRPLLRGDRLRIAIDANTPAAEEFLKNVSIINLNVVLTVAPPIQVALLRTNLGSTATASGLGGNQAPEVDELNAIDQCFQEILGQAGPPVAGRRPCKAPVEVALGADGKLHCVKYCHGELALRKILLLTWPYTLPGDVIPTIYLSALYTTPENGDAWHPSTFYPPGSVVACPGEDMCQADTNTLAGVGGRVIAASGLREPKWLGPGVVSDGDMGEAEPVLWKAVTPIHVTPIRPGGPHYAVGDKIEWQSGQSTLEATVVPWTPGNHYTADESVVLIPSDSHTSARLYVATTSGWSGQKPPTSWVNPITADSGGKILWRYEAGATDQLRGRREGDHIVWPSGEELTHSIVETWQPDTDYYAGQSVILCPGPRGLSRLCAATKTTGRSGVTPPDSWRGPTVDDAGVTWVVDVPSTLDRWQAQTPYESGATIRCEQPAQRNNQCVATVGGFSGKVEPWWAQGSGAAAASAATPSATATQRDNQVLWSPYAPSSTTASPAANQVVNLGVEELPQVHAPSLYGLSTAVLFTTHKVPNSYNFSQAITAACPSPGSTTAAGVSVPATTCPAVATSYQKATDIALMVSPYVVHHFYSRWVNPEAPDGIDTESRWTGTHVEDWLPEPIAGFGLNTVGNSYYVGASFEVLVRNLQLVVGYSWIKAPTLTHPVTGVGGSGGSVTPTTYQSFNHSPFVGLAFNISGLITGH